MRTRFTLLTLVALAAAGLASAQSRSAAPKAAPTPRAADGHVDFSGMWSPDRNFIYDIHDTLEKGADLPLQPWAEKLARERIS